jgi:hypothetical protein
MSLTDTEANVLKRPPLLGWPRLAIAFVVSTLMGVLLSLPSATPVIVVIARALVVGIGTLMTFGIFERWPTHLPDWVGRWVVQLIAIGAVVPFAALLAYWLTTGGHPDLSKNGPEHIGYFMLTLSGIFFAPLIAIGALLRQRDTFAQQQAHSFALERSEFERQALNARFSLLQAQVEPHFLFNTLANVQTLVQSGAPQAIDVLESLIAYLRAAVPRLHETSTTLGQELELVRAYLDVMHMRMPDRLQFALLAEPGTSGFECPPMTLLPLVENAVRHGVDPSETGGRIDINVSMHSGRCVARVTDTGIGLQAAGHGLGTGLVTLRERMQLAFGNDIELRLSDVLPHGVCATLTFPCRMARP